MRPNRDSNLPKGSASSDESSDHQERDNTGPPNHSQEGSANEESPPLSPPLPEWPTAMGTPARAYAIELREPSPSPPSPNPEAAIMANRQAIPANMKTGYALPFEYSDRGFEGDGWAHTSVTSFALGRNLPPPPNVADPMARVLLDPYSHLRRSQRLTDGRGEGRRKPQQLSPSKRIVPPDLAVLGERIRERRRLTMADFASSFDQERSASGDEQRSRGCRLGSCCFYGMRHDGCVPPLEETPVQSALWDNELLEDEELDEKVADTGADELGPEVQALVEALCRSALKD